MFKFNLLSSVTKKYVIRVKGFKPATSCVKGKDFITVPARCERQNL